MGVKGPQSQHADCCTEKADTEVPAGVVCKQHNNGGHKSDPDDDADEGPRILGAGEQVVACPQQDDCN